jgi:hypothetical protein
MGIYIVKVIFRYRLSQNWRTNFLLPYRGYLNVHEKNMEKMFQTKKILLLNGNTM